MNQVSAVPLIGEKERLHWLEPLKAIALVLIAFNHALESLGEYPLVANPTADWLPLSERVSQLSPVTGDWWDAAFNVIRYPGLLGEVGVQLFIIASGLGLTLSAMRRGIDRGYYRRRVRRIVPLWVVVHLLALAASVPVLLFFGWRADEIAAAPWDARFWASLAGLRFTPSALYYLVPAWWFITLLIQLYLVFPFLYRMFERWGTRLFGPLIGGAIVIKLLGLLIFDTYLDAWSRGAIFITRLPEFALGMLVAVWLTRGPNRLKTPAAVGLAAIAVPAGIASSLLLVGNAWGPFLYGAGLFVLLYRWLSTLSLEGRVASAAAWVGRHSLSVFVVHQAVLQILLPDFVASPVRVLGGLAVAVPLTWAAAVVLEWVVEKATRAWQRWSSRGVVLRRAFAIALGALVLYVGFVGADWWVRSNDPQEVLGWGERPSLEADDALGWRLIPEQTTRLRWQGYDYEVSSNRYGFPGPVEAPGSSDLRVLALGDAFTSAEGVDTGDAWPRLLEGLVDGPATVWNGAVTGYGPLQYAGAAELLAPILEPDVVVVGFFVNDFADAVADLEEARDAIGFGRPDPTGAAPTLQWRHLSKYLAYNVTEPVLAIAGVPNRTGYFLGNFAAFETGAVEAGDDGYRAALAALERVKAAAPQARVVLMLVPASIQVCEPGALDYYPENVDGGDFDLDQPQQAAAALAGELGAEVLDLRPVLTSAAECPYHPANMHWLEHGHRLAAEALAGFLEGKAS